MTFTFFNSDKVKIFPCARRGSFTDSEQKVKIYDAESRLTTESNLTRLLGLAFNKDSYIIDTTPIAGVTNGQLWRLVIKGYYFEVETTLPRIDYFVIGLEETNSIPRTRLGVLARDDQKGLGQDSAATKVDIVNVNTLESECRAICAVSFDAGDTELSLDNSFCHWVSTADTLDILNDKYLNSSLDSEFSNLKAADEQILAEAKNYAAGLAGNYEAAGSIATSIANLKANELASIEGRLGIIEGSGEGSIAEAITKAVTEANAYADEAEANANQYSDSKANTAQANAEAEAARLDGLLKTELQAEIDSDVAAAITSEVTRSDAKAKELADAAQAAAEASAQNKVNSLAVGAVKTNTENIRAINTDFNSKIDALRNEIGNLTNVMNFRGAVDAETDITDPIEGDVITIKGTGVEKVYSAGTWTEIGTASAFDAAISDIEARLSTIEDPENGSIAMAKADAKAYTDARVEDCLTELKSYSDLGKAAAMEYTDDQLSTFQTTINETVASASSAAATASTASSLANDLQDRFNKHETQSQGKFNELNTLFTQQDNLSKTNKSRLDTLAIQCEQFNTDLQKGTSALTNLDQRVLSIESDYIKKTALGDAIGIYAVAFDVSRCDTSVLEATFIQATSNPIIFIPDCTTLPKASGYTWQDAEGNQITEDSINKNLILYLTKV